jgi:hypothetical protein
VEIDVEHRELMFVSKGQHCPYESELANENEAIDDEYQQYSSNANNQDEGQHKIWQLA